MQRDGKIVADASAVGAKHCLPCIVHDVRTRAKVRMYDGCCMAVCRMAPYVCCNVCVELLVGRGSQRKGRTQPRLRPAIYRPSFSGVLVLEDCSIVLEMLWRYVPSLC